MTFDCKHLILYITHVMNDLLVNMIVDSLYPMDLYYLL